MILGGGFGGGAGGGNLGGGATAVPYVTEKDFEAVVLRSELPVFLYFTAAWCQPCKTVGPEVDSLAKDLEGKAKVVKIDIDKSPFLAKQFRVQSVPMFFVFAQGRIVDGQAGALSKKALRAMIEPYLPRSAGALKAKELAQLLQAGSVIPVDTREKAAFDRAHLPKAVHMDLETLADRIAELYMLPGQPVLYCRAGDKTKELSGALAEQGVDLPFLEGGMLAWEMDFLPIERG